MRWLITQRIQRIGIWLLLSEDSQDWSLGSEDPAALFYMEPGGVVKFTLHVVQLMSYSRRSDGSTLKGTRKGIIPFSNLSRRYRINLDIILCSNQ